MSSQEVYPVPLELRLVQHCLPGFDFPIGFHHESRIIATQCFCFAYDFVVRFIEVKIVAVGLWHIPGGVHIKFEVIAFRVGEVDRPCVAVAGLAVDVHASGHQSVSHFTKFIKTLK